VIDWWQSVRVRLVINTKPQAYADGDTGLAGEFFVDTSEPSGRRSGVMLVHGGAQHGFTHTDAEPGAIPGVAYHEQADILSFAATRDFLARTFGENR
jgi:hypothetical protein